MATPTLLSVSNVALPNTADSGNVSVTAPTGANACVIGGTFYVGDNSVVTSLTGSQLTSTTNGGLTTASPTGGNYMSSYAGAFQVTATGSQTIRLQKTGGYGEGPTCQIAWLTVDDPTDFVRTGGFLIDTQASSPDTLSVALASAATDLVLGFFGTDGSSSDPSAPSGATQQGTLQTTQLDKSIVFSVDSPGASTTTITVGSRAYPTLIGISLKAGTGGPTNYTLTCDVGSYSLTGIAALLRRGYSIVANVGSYAITGQAATLVYGRRLICATGSYSITGYDADLIYTTTGPTNYSLACDRGTYSLTGSDAALTYVDGSAPVGSPHGFVISDTAPKLWWQRKPKALDEEEAEQKIAKVVRVVERIALRQVEAQQPALAKEQKREVREAIAPLVAEMPGFDWMTLYRTILIELGRRQQEQQAAELAQMEIARIQAIRRDEDDVLLLLMSI